MTVSLTGAYSEKQRDRQQYGDVQTKSYREDGGQRIRENGQQAGQRWRKKCW